MPSPPALPSSLSSSRCIPPALLPLRPWRQWRVFGGRAPELARLRSWLKELLPDALCRDDVVTIAVELADNAIQHTASGQGAAFTVELRWRAEPPAIRVTVADAGAPERPRWPQRAPGIAESGYGLYIVRRLAARTGVSGDRHGRQVWAEVPWAGPPPQWTRPGPGTDQPDR